MTALVLALAAHLHRSAPARAALVAPLVLAAADAAGVPPRALAKLAAHESGSRWWIVGAHGDLGLTQLHRPLPARYAGLTRAELLDPATNLRIGAEMLADALARCHGRLRGALSRYNRGHSCRPSGYADRVLAETLP